MRLLLIAGMTLALATGAYALTDSYGWEDGVGTILGSYLGVVATNVTSPVHTGGHSLQTTESPLSGTPQAYLAWIWGLQDGDVVELRI